MDYQSNYAPQKDLHDSFSNAAMILGALSIVTGIMMTVYPPLVLGGLAILIALLSRGNEPVLRSKAKIGILCGIAGLILDIAIIAGSVYLVFSNAEYKEQFDTLYEQLYGETFEDTIEENWGIDL